MHLVWGPIKWKEWRKEKKEKREPWEKKEGKFNLVFLWDPQNKENNIILV